MQAFFNYLSSPEIVLFFESTGNFVLLSTIAVAFVALLLELHLPLRYYWGLPGFFIKSFLAGIKVKKQNPLWGVCSIQGEDTPLSMVVCELLDERTHKIVMSTFSNRMGQYGFPLRPGRYLLRAIKARYRLPSLLDPENVEVYEVDESFALSVIVLNKEVAPLVDLPLVPTKKITEFSTSEKVMHYARMFLFQLGNAFLALDIILALIGFASTRSMLYGLLLAVSVVLLVIKLFVLETISVVARNSHA